MACHSPPSLTQLPSESLENKAAVIPHDLWRLRVTSTKPALSLSGRVASEGWPPSLTHSVDLAVASLISRLAHGAIPSVDAFLLCVKNRVQEEVGHIVLLLRPNSGHVLGPLATPCDILHKYSLRPLLHRSALYLSGVILVLKLIADPLPKPKKGETLN